VIGLFVPLFALRSGSDGGIGDTETLKELIGWCGARGIRVLQLLPINETSGDNSPYNAVSSVALEPSTLAMTVAAVPGLEESDRQECLPDDVLNELRSGSVQYARIKAIKQELLWRAFSRLAGEPGDPQAEEWRVFCEEESHWLRDYGLFRSCMHFHDGSPVWEEWPEAHSSPGAVRHWLDGEAGEAAEAFRLQVDFYSFQQWVAYRQWAEVRRVADAQGVTLMGDIPFGLSRHSADVWARKEEFDLERYGGAPPEPLFQDDPFVKRWGQNWGIPLYRWDVMADNGYAWWRQRVQMTTRIFKAFRVDHILGFYRIYSFPWGPGENVRYTEMEESEVEAIHGELPGFQPRPDEPEDFAEQNRRDGEKLLRVIQEAAGEATVIGEDLGMVPDYVRPSLMELGISGFKIPVFERDESSQEYKPLEEYPYLTVATLTTHDHVTMRGFWEQWWDEWSAVRDLPEGSADRGKGEQASWELYRTQRMAHLDDRELIHDYMPTVHNAITRRIMESGSWLVVLNITDLFGMKLRFNVPGPIADSNWSARLPWTVAEMEDDPDREECVRVALEAARECGRLTD